MITAQGNKLFGLGLARFHALIEGLELIEDKAKDRGLIIWDHERAIRMKNARDYSKPYSYKKKTVGRQRKEGGGRKRRPRDVQWEEALFGGKVLRISGCALLHYVIPRGDRIYNDNYEELNVVR